MHPIALSTLILALAICFGSMMFCVLICSKPELVEEVSSNDILNKVLHELGNPAQKTCAKYFSCKKWCLKAQVFSWTRMLFVTSTIINPQEI